MAGDWIKMRDNLWDDPRVARVVDMTDSSEAAVIGSLYWLWSTADQHTEDGFMPGLTLRSIDRKTGLQGFAAALCSIGWMEEKENGVVIIDFEKHNGESAKKRCQTAKRVAKHAAANAGKDKNKKKSNGYTETTNATLTQTSETTNASLTQEIETTNVVSVSSALAREREEKSNTPLTPLPGGDRDAAFAEIPETQTPPPRPSMATAACVAMRSVGMATVNPSSPTLLALVEAGAGVDVFSEAARYAVGHGKGFSYALSIVKNQLAEAEKIAPMIASKSSVNPAFAGGI